VPKKRKIWSLEVEEKPLSGGKHQREGIRLILFVVTKKNDVCDLLF
jgi:hypothetical protein